MTHLVRIIFLIGSLVFKWNNFSFSNYLEINGGTCDEYKVVNIHDWLGYSYSANLSENWMSFYNYHMTWQIFVLFHILFFIIQKAKICLWSLINTRILCLFTNKFFLYFCFLIKQKFWFLFLVLFLVLDKLANFMFAS